ncbi:MAG: hypothetical protein ACRDLF_05935 [Solirubrobacteraceae bacterium]
MAVTLGALMDRLCIVGGLAPSLLVDRQANAVPSGEAGHAGTNDLDIGLAVALLDEQQYSEISRRLHQEGFAAARRSVIVPRRRLLVPPHS